MARRRRTRKPAYYDEQGRPRTRRGFLIGKTFGMHGSEFRQDYTWHPDWLRNTDWYSSIQPEPEPGAVYDNDGRRGIRLLSDIYKGDSRYTTFNGEPVPGYDGPYMCYNAVRYLRRRGVRVPPWAMMRSAGRSHSIDHISYPGLGGAPWKGYGGTDLNGVYRPHKKA